MASKNLAPKSGYYTLGKGTFKIRKGSRLPEKGKFDEIFFYDEKPQAGSLVEQMIDDIAENTSDDAPAEIVAEEVKTTEKPKVVRTPKAS